MSAHSKLCWLFRFRRSLGWLVGIFLSLAQAFVSVQAEELEPLPERLATMDPVEAGQLLAQRMRASAPAEAASFKGSLKIRRSNSRELLRIPFRSEIRPRGDTWQAIYETAKVEQIPAQKLTIIHTPKRAPEYLFARAAKPGEAPKDPVRLTNDQAAISLADSDFWLSDLGLEFAHWPSQRFLRGEVRANRFCYVLESANPNKSNTGYGRVLSWVDKETGGVVAAEGYDRSNKLLKEFSIRGFTKVQGQWQLQEMKIRNAQTRSSTWLEFDYSEEPRRQ